MKFLHYMPIPSEVYNGGTIKMINTDERFKNEEHVFWIKHPISIDGIQSSNVFYRPRVNYKDLNKAADTFDYIIFHAWNISYFDQLIIKTKTARKIIWCVWGHDLYKYSNSFKYNGIKELMKKFLIRQLLIYIQNPLIKKIHSICYSFPYDKHEIQRLYGETKLTYHVSYDFEYNVKDILQMKKAQNDIINIMIGHSAYKFLNHIKVLEQLKRYKGQKLEIYLPLNYGDIQYKDTIKKYCKTYPLKVHILEEKLTSEKYLEYLLNIDIAIMDFQHQAALGNIYLLLLLGKKLYVDGIVYHGLKEVGIQVFNTSLLEKNDYKSLINMDYDNEYGKLWVKKIVDKEETRIRWKNLFDNCKRI